MVGEVKEFRDGLSASETGVVALFALAGLIELVTLVLVVIDSRILDLFSGMFRDLFAMGAEEPDEPLGKDAVQRGYEVVRLNSHVQEPTEHIEGIIRVDRGEDQVAGQRGLHCNLASLGVADLADHDFVRIVPQD